jgi:hypothetical protein
VITRGFAGALVSCLLILTSAAMPARAPTSGLKALTYSSNDAKLTKTGHVALIGCPSSDATIQVTMRRLVYTKSQRVTVEAVLRNVGTSDCQYVAPAGAEPPWLGLCGLLSLTVDNQKGVLVFPAKGTVNCPALVNRVLTPGASLRASGSWNQRKLYPSRGFVPRGKYRLTVGNVVTFSVTLR